MKLPLIAAVVLVAILTLPYALAPGVNSADLVLWLSPFAVLWIGGMSRRRPRRPKGPRLVAHIGEEHPDGLTAAEERYLARIKTTAGGHPPRDSSSAKPPAVPPTT